MGDNLGNNRSRIGRFFAHKIKLKSNLINKVATVSTEDSTKRWIVAAVGETEDT